MTLEGEPIDLPGAHGSPPADSWSHRATKRYAVVFYVALVAALLLALILSIWSVFAKLS